MTESTYTRMQLVQATTGRRPFTAHALPAKASR
jgi:hypothetical protein